MKLLSLVASLLVACAILGAEPDIVLPVSPTPVVPPAPVGTSIKLTGSQVYDVRCKVPCVVRAYPACLVTITKEEVAAGETLRVKDDFSDGAKTHVYKGAMTVYSVQAKGTGPINLVIVPVGFKAEADIVTVGIDVDAGQGPQPPPNPKPDPKPDPKPEPFGPSKLFLLVVEETEEAVPGRGAYFTDKALSARIKDKQHTWRVVDKDVKDSTGKVPADLAPYFAKIQGKKLPQVLLVDPQGKTRFAGDLPETPALLLEQILKVGG